MIDEPRSFAVTLTEIGEPLGIAGAATRSCMCCGRVLGGMGGGGRCLCSDCLRRMDTGELALAIREFEREHAR
jgi:hypothetical protein